MEEIIIIEEQIDIEPLTSAAQVFIWRFQDAPKVLKDLSVNGGDEDWIAVLSDEFWIREQGFIGFLQENTAFGPLLRGSIQSR